ncbi:MAG: response regulator, partial [Candidatus Aegiribacteria sp.]|nr:response regulator [Candidatus Aegiribacteria sp.]
MAKILVIDDDEMIRKMLVTAFQSDDYEVIQASDGRTGLREFRSGDVDVVITDIIMPDMEGIETIRELRKIDPEARIIAFSGGGA